MNLFKWHDIWNTILTNGVSMCKLIKNVRLVRFLLLYPACRGHVNYSGFLRVLRLKACTFSEEVSYHDLLLNNFPLSRSFAKSLTGYMIYSGFFWLCIKEIITSELYVCLASKHPNKFCPLLENRNMITWPLIPFCWSPGGLTFCYIPDNICSTCLPFSP